MKAELQKLLDDLDVQTQREVAAYLAYEWFGPGRASQDMHSIFSATAIRALKAGVDPDIILKRLLENSASLSQLRQTRAQFLKLCEKAWDEELRS